MFRQLSQNSKQSDNHHNERCFAAKLRWPNPVCPSASENSNCTALKRALSSYWQMHFSFHRGVKQNIWKMGRVKSKVRIWQEAATGSMETRS